MFDTHCHLTFPQLAKHVNEVIAAAREAGVDRMICVGTTPEDAANALTLAKQHKGIFATAGLHPHYATADMDDRQLRDALRGYAQEEKLVALGEMGLDYHYPDPPRDVQAQSVSNTA